MICKVSDFGLSRELEDDPDSEYQTQVKLLLLLRESTTELYHFMTAEINVTYPFTYYL